MTLNDQIKKNKVGKIVTDAFIKKDYISFFKREKEISLSAIYYSYLSIRAFLREKKEYYDGIFLKNFFAERKKNLRTEW